MIEVNSRKKDPEDVGALFHALIRYIEANSDELDKSVPAFGYAALLELADEAAEAIALHHVDEGRAWDGATWFGDLESIKQGCLAESLLKPDADVESVVKEWLKSVQTGWTEILHKDQRWSFDADHLAQWVEGDKEFHFHVFHGLADPTIESVTQFIDQL